MKFSLEYWPRRSPLNTAAVSYPGAIWNYRCTGIFTSWWIWSPMLARLGPASFLSCGRDSSARFIRCTLYSHWHSAAILVHYHRFHISLQPPVGLRVRGRKLEGRTSQYQAFASAIAWLLVPALLNFAHSHQPVAIASISQWFHCFHLTPRGRLRLELVGHLQI